jgi:amicyanin
MNKRETILAICTIIIGAVATWGVIVFTGSNKTETTLKSGNQDMSNMANQPDQEIGEIVDLTNQSEVAMDIKDFRYEKANIKIKKGTKVTWTNQDTIKHNVMEEHEGSGKAHDAPTPSEVDPNELAGPLLAKGESYSFTFNEVSSSPYHCSPHPYMKGSVTVVE